MKVTAKARRAGGWWAVEVLEVPGAFTQTRRLGQVAAAAAEAVADLRGIDASQVEVTLDPELAEDVDAIIEAARNAAEMAASAQAEATRRMRAAVQRLRQEEALTTRDAAALLGVTHQRVAQIQEQVAAQEAASSERAVDAS